jgi:DNA polymerase-3 subunit gamma/tau
MTYLVLARKWRPRSFETLIGQDHVVRALSHALATQRLHHAWLFTGTRGVGKTTLSRLLAKSLNCEQGITAKPCGTCRACVEIDEGRFVDYLELDAASNRGVDEMTQLLEQAVYAPSSGRFKVYMIDEVHMLSGHAFNAMLKTLEEPPPHVKFILATTDPQKIPPTVLSRCLQFNLKQMPPIAVAEHLNEVLTAEGVDFEPTALKLIGQAAAGSMRDALSLTDQAIAFSAGNMTEDAVRTMLGNVDQTHLIRLIDALAQQKPHDILAIADEFAQRGLSMRTALADLAILLSRIAIAQRIPANTDVEDPVYADIQRLAQSVPADVVQVLYTVAVHSRQELTLAPDEYAGFVMTCLRMLSLCEGQAAPPATGGHVSGGGTSTQSPVTKPVAVAPAPVAAAPVAAAPVAVAIAAAPIAAAPIAAAPIAAAPAAPAPAPAPAAPIAAAPIAAAPAPTFATQKIEPISFTHPDQWPSFIASLPLSGMALQLARQSECVSVQPNALSLRVPNQSLAQGPHAERLLVVLKQALGAEVDVDIAVGELVTGVSAHNIDEKAQQVRQLQAEESVAQDPFVQTLIRDFDAHVVPGSIQPVPPTLH